MIIQELIELLKRMPPKDPVIFSIGGLNDHTYRERVAKAAVMNKYFIDSLVASHMEIQTDANEDGSVDLNVWIVLMPEQDFLKAAWSSEDECAEFDKNIN